MKFQHLSAYTELTIPYVVTKNHLGTKGPRPSTFWPKSNRRARQLATSPLDRKDSWTYYHYVYLPSVLYSLPVGHMPPSMLAKIQAPAIRTFLPKWGYNRNMPSV
jgi:hypothetical protein